MKPLSIVILLLIQIIIFNGCMHKKYKKNTKRIYTSKEKEFEYLNEIFSPTVLVQLLDNSDNIELGGVGFTGNKNMSYPIYNRLCSVAEDTTLLRLIYHKNPNIRVYAVLALRKKNDSLATLAYNQLLTDSSFITVSSCCMIDVPSTVFALLSLNSK